MILGIASLLFPMFSAICVCSSTANNFWGAADPGTYSTAAVVAAIGLIAAGVGLVLSIMGMKELQAIGQPAGMAIAGLVCSIVGIVFCLSCTACQACTCSELQNTYRGTSGWLDDLFTW